jgi:hypothetical protein
MLLLFLTSCENYQEIVCNVKEVKTKKQMVDMVASAEYIYVTVEVLKNSLINMNEFNIVDGASKNSKLNSIRPGMILKIRLDRDSFKNIPRENLKIVYIYSIKEINILSEK